MGQTTRAGSACIAVILAGVCVSQGCGKPNVRPTLPSGAQRWEVKNPTQCPVRVALMANGPVSYVVQDLGTLAAGQTQEFRILAEQLQGARLSASIDPEERQRCRPNNTGRTGITVKKVS